MTMIEINTTRFIDEGFLQHSPGREFMVEGHGHENGSGLLGIKIVLERAESDPVVEAAMKQGLKFDPTFDDAHSSLVMLETIGQLAHVEHLAKTLASKGFHRLGEL
jgi:hypothetical protein